MKTVRKIRGGWAILLVLGGTVAAYAIDPAAGHMVEALPERDYGREVYVHYCLRCHGPDRKKITGASLTPRALNHYQTKDLIAKIGRGCTGNTDGTYRTLEAWQLLKVARFLQREDHRKR
jgi:mono/diheme cytochrome c family protein